MLSDLLTPEEEEIAVRANSLLQELCDRGWGPSMVIETICNMMVLMYAHQDCPNVVRYAMLTATRKLVEQFETEPPTEPPRNVGPS